MNEALNKETGNEHPLLIGTLVALGATGIFLYVVASTLLSSSNIWDVAEANPRALLEPLFLSTALIFLAWRRVVEVRKSNEEIREAGRKQYQLAYFDEVSGLHNRRYLMDQVLASLVGKSFSLIFLDLDGFKKVNDLYGHGVGDTLLAEVAARIRDVCPEEAIVVRLGGDEFAICIEGDADTSGSLGQLAGALVTSIGQPFVLGEVRACVSASIGIARMDGDEDCAPAEIVHRADIAMYEAKRRGRNRFVWFDAGMEQTLLARNELEADIRAGIARGDFVPHFQAQFDLEDFRLKGFEVLARWNNPELGIRPPDEFIPVAEETGLIATLSLSVMRQALTQALAWPDDLTIAVNVSPIQFRDPLLAERIGQLLDEVGFPPDRLELEITESAIVDDKAQTLATVTRFKEMGIKVSLDDFGTGYASLSQLRELPFDRIKIDKSFVATLVEDKQSGAIVEAIAALGRSLSLPITAEGVEEQGTQTLLTELGCTDAQGWLYGKAMSAEDVADTYFGLKAPAVEAAPPAEIAMPTAERRSYGRRGR